MRALVFLPLIFLIFGTIVSAETIELKNGKEIVGKIIQETDEALVVSKGGGSFVYSIARDEIKEIRPSTDEELRTVLPAAKVGARDTKEKQDRKEAVKKYRLEQYEKEVLAAKKARGRIKIKFSKNRFGVVDATLNGKATVALLVDTGASMVVISREVANRLGLEEKDEKGKINVVLADGSTTTARAITLDSVKVGTSEVKNVNAAISETPPGGGLDGLLGMTFLRYFHVKVDAKENSLILEKY